LQRRQFLICRLTLLCIECCGFVNEEFPTEIQEFAKKQQLLVKLNIAIFNTRCWA
jgi:hypothetical protein